MAKRVMMFGDVGVAVLEDLLLIQYFNPPTVPDIEAIGEMVDALLAENDESILVAQLIVDQKGVPSIAAQRAGAQLMERTAPRVREIIAFAMGDSFRVIVIRSVLRAVNMLSRKKQIVVDTLEMFHAEVAKHASAKTPRRWAIDAALEETKALYDTAARAKSA